MTSCYTVLFNISVLGGGNQQLYNLKTQLEDLRFPTLVTDVEQINQFIDVRKLIDGHNGFNCTYDIDTNE